MSNEHVEDPVSPSVQELVTVFKNDLSAVSFPDVSLEILDSLTQKVRSCAQELNDAVKRAQSARESLEAGQNELAAKAARGLAYAKVFAEGNDALQERLAKITFGKTARSSKKTALDKPNVEKQKSETAPADGLKPEEKKPVKASKKAMEPN